MPSETNTKPPVRPRGVSEAELAQVRAQVARDRQEDKAAAEALAEPLPGVLRDVFAVQPDIQCGPYAVRPFYDRDHEFFEAINHPLEQMMKDAMVGKESGADFMPTGLAAWQASWIMTRPVREVARVLREGGAEALSEAAREQFGELQLGALNAIALAIARQMTIYVRSVVAYGPESEKGGAGANP